MKHDSKKSKTASPLNGEQIFEKVFELYYEEMIFLAFSYIKDMEASKDIAQEVFLDYWKRKEVIEIHYSIKYFLRKAIVNQTLVTIKKQNKLKLNNSIELSTTRNEDALSIIEFNELKDQVEAIIASLPEKRRTIFIMSRYEQLSHQEISARLNISKKTIENQITQALKYIRQRLFTK